VILKGWKQPEGAVHLVTPPGGPRPARVEVLAEFLAKHFAKGKKRAGNRSVGKGRDRRAFADLLQDFLVRIRLQNRKQKRSGEKLLR
jgi:hypothetical protein